VTDQKSILHRYLQIGREVLLAKLDGVSEYDARRPLVPTGTNLLGVIKHVASVEAGYLGDCFGRPFEQTFPWFADDAEWNADMWATADESRESIVDLYHRVWRHSDATIETLDLEAIGEVAWWTEGRRVVTLQQILVHMIAETHRHAGHMDIVRELIDGEVCWKPDAGNMPPADADWWEAFRQRLEDAAQQASETDRNR